MSVNVIAIHPEDLFDRRGGLTPSEGARLKAHLARCATCEIEVKLRADFATELRDGDEMSWRRARS